MGVAILFGVFVITLVMGVPVALALGMASAAYLVGNGMPLVVIPQKMFAGIDVFVLLCIPGFILAGNLMNGGGITERIIRFANALVGWIRGGLGLTNIAGSMIFAGVSGTAVGDAASLGGVLIPGMKKAGYPADFSAAVTAASSTIGPIIPPSVPMIIVGALTGVSVGRMFLAGAIPGLLLGLGLMITCYLIARRRGYPHLPWRGWGELVRAFAGAFWALAMTVLILAGLMSGIATPSETAIVASLYALVVGGLVYRGLAWRDLPRVLVSSAVSSAAILTLVGFANVFGWILASERIPQMLADAVLSLTDNKILIILLLNVLLLVIGSFMETIAALIILFTPLMAVAVAVGVDPVHFATFGVLNLMIGLTTPPVGVCLFVCANIARLPLGPVIGAVLPFLASNLVVLLLVSFIPALSLWLPNLVFGN
ncbi:MAG: TRAP transporter large permease [Pseudomonadota bacterium]